MNRRFSSRALGRVLVMAATGAIGGACSGSSDDGDQTWPSVEDGGSGGSGSSGNRAGRGGGGDAGSAAAKGIWNRFNSASRYETDVAYGAIHGESADRVYMCEWNSPSAGLYKGRLTQPDLIRWDSEHRLPDYKVVFLGTDHMSFLPQTGTDDFLGEYKPGSWRMGSCGFEFKDGEVVKIGAVVTTAPFKLAIESEATAVEPGSTVAVTVTVSREAGFTGPIAIDVEGLPEGGSAPAVTVPSDATSVALRLVLPAKLPNGATIIALHGTADGREARVGHALVARGSSVVYERDNNSISIGATGRSTMMLRADGSLLSWGDNAYGQLGVPLRNYSREATPILVPSAVPFALVDAGERNACALDEQGAAYCWGSQWSGQLGDGVWAENPGQVHPMRFAPGLVHGNHVFATITVGNDFACALTPEGKAWCWGSNKYGQLGDGTVTDRTTPTEVLGGHTFASVSAGVDHACALTLRGQAYCWGFGGGRQLGTELPENPVTANAIAEPAAVLGGLTFASIRAGGSAHTCALTPAGRAYCWGTKAPGLGNEDIVYPDYNRPFEVDTDLSFVRLEPASGTTCGLTRGGELYCWGDGTYGQFGDSTVQETLRWAPSSPVRGPRFSDVDVGRYHLCALDSEGQPWCWGHNDAGQIGSGPVGSQYALKEPVAVTLGTISGPGGSGGAGNAGGSGGSGNAPSAGGSGNAPSAGGSGNAPSAGGSSGIGSAGSSSGAGGKGGTGGTGGKGGTGGSGGAGGASPYTLNWLNGFIQNTNPVGIHGYWFTFTDLDMSSISPTGDGAFASAGPNVCVSGTSARYVDSSDWGATLAFNFNQEMGSPDFAAWDAAGQFVSGFRFTLSGPAVPSRLQVNLKVAGSDTVYCSILSGVTSDTARIFTFSAARERCWQPTPGGGADLSRLESIEFNVPGVATQATPFGFCVTRVDILG